MRRRSRGSSAAPGRIAARSRVIGLVLLLAIAGAAPAAASEVVPESFRSLVREAATIVVGRVTTARAIRSVNREIETVATVAVRTTLKGTPQTFVSVVVPGGEIGRTRTVMVGAPRLRAGDEAVFFLVRGADGLWRPLGLAAGVYRVHTRSDGVPVVRPPLVPNRTAPAGRVVRGDPRRDLLAVSAFADLVRLAESARVARPRIR